MARFSTPDAQEDERDQALPADAEHIVVTDSKFGGPQPDGIPDGEHILYERGDELPFEKSKELVSEHPTSLVALNADGNVVAGGDAPAIGGLTEPRSGLEETLKRWRSGEGFDPEEYEAERAAADDANSDGGGGD